MKRKEILNILRFWILLFVIIFYNNQYSYSQKADEYELKAAYILNFSYFAEWPKNTVQSSKNTPFIITVFGKNPFKKKLENIIKKKRKELKGKTIIFKYTDKLENVSNSNIIFIASSEKLNISKIIAYVRGKPILTISDTEGYDNKGVMINMVKKGSKVKFNVNLKEAYNSKIHISSRLLVNAMKIIK